MKIDRLPLMFELREIYHLLKKYNIINTYYKSYISPIIEEFLDTTEDDYILKKILGARLERIRTGFSESIDNSAVFYLFSGKFPTKPVQEFYIRQILKFDTSDKVLESAVRFYKSHPSVLDHVPALTDNRKTMKCKWILLEAG